LRIDGTESDTRAARAAGLPGLDCGEVLTSGEARLLSVPVA